MRGQRDGSRAGPVDRRSRTGSRYAASAMARTRVRTPFLGHRASNQVADLGPGESLAGIADAAPAGDGDEPPGTPAEPEGPGHDSPATDPEPPGTHSEPPGEDSPDQTSTLAAIADSVESAAGTVAQAVTQTTASLVRGATDLADGASRRFDERPGANARRQRRAAREPLPVLWQVHPEAVNAQRRDLGLVAVPVDQIRGTAVEGAQRAGDYLPIPRLRGTNWEARYARIRSAVNRMAMLPPIELLKTGDEYWVVDGHNRVAVARELGQIALDASVVELPLPGGARTAPDALIGGYLAEDIRDVRAAGSGRHSRTAGPTADLKSTEQLRREFGHDHPGEGGTT